MKYTVHFLILLVMRSEYEIENDGSKAAEDCKTEGGENHRATKVFPLENSYVIYV